MKSLLDKGNLEALVQRKNLSHSARHKHSPHSPLSSVDGSHVSNRGCKRKTCLKANASNIKRSETRSNAHKTHVCSFHYAMSGNLSTEYKDTIMSEQRIAGGEGRGGGGGGCVGRSVYSVMAGLSTERFPTSCEAAGGAECTS